MELALPPLAPFAIPEFPFDVPPAAESSTLTEEPVPAAVADELLMALPAAPSKEVAACCVKDNSAGASSCTPNGASNVDAALEVTLSIELAAPPDPLIAASPCPPESPRALAVAAALADEPVVIAAAVACPPLPPAAPVATPDLPPPPIAAAVFVWSVEIALAVAGPPFVPGFPLIPGVPGMLTVTARAGTAAMIIEPRATRLIFKIGIFVCRGLRMRR
jgi:hypothetical protein